MLKLFALGTLVLGFAFVGSIYQVVQAHRHHTLDIRTAGISDLLSLVGFCLTSVGFWSAANVHDQAPASDSREVERAVR